MEQPIAYTMRIELEPRSTEDRLADAKIALDHFMRASVHHERKAQNHLEQAACYRTRADELVEKVLDLETEILAKNPS